MSLFAKHARPARLVVTEMGSKWVVDTYRFPESSGVAGEVTADKFPRLIDEVGDFGSLELKASPVRSPRGKRGMLLEASGVVQLTCQRCLKAMEFKVAVQAKFEFAYRPEEVDGLSGDDEWDALESSERLDLLGVAEDEVLLGLPYAPRHAQCDPAGPREAGEKVSPFAALAGLKKS
jgi:uncharacterized protein